MRFESKGSRNKSHRTKCSRPSRSLAPTSSIRGSFQLNGSVNGSKTELDDTLRSVPTTSREPHETTDQGERDPRHETLPSSPTRASEPEESAVPIGPGSGHPNCCRPRPHRGEALDAPQICRDRPGHQSPIGETRRLAAMPRQQAFRAVRKCAASELKSRHQHRL